ncbi:MAG: tRNA lysidine(34) synthetase TilS [Bacteroidetes bacterium]|nr:tRNA lysidine(34) synthetase TilS [Bacteroidota bacterium]
MKSCNKLEIKNQTVLIAISGGIDSVVLFNLFLRVQDKLNLNFRLAHVNHLLRGKESLRDQKFVEEYSLKNNIPLDLLVADTKNKKGSIQKIAREIRYKYFIEKAIKYNCKYIATAHNKNDNSETLLLNLFRGAGIEGLSGIPVKNIVDGNQIVRPLLEFERSEILKYAKLKKYNWVEDSSNKKNKYKRNYIRNKLLPQIQKNYNPNIIQTLSKTAELLSKQLFINQKKCTEFINKHVLKKTNSILVSKKEFLKNEDLIQLDIIKTILEDLKIESSFILINSILELFNSQNGTSCDCSENWIAQIDRGYLIFSEKNISSNIYFQLFKEGKIETNSWNLSIKSTAITSIKKNGKSNNVEIIDADLVNYPITIRSWQSGDYFYPLGMYGKKKISDYFVDQKIPMRQKKSIPLIESDNKIIWLAGFRIDERFKITNKTKNFIELKIDYKNE